LQALLPALLGMRSHARTQVLARAAARTITCAHAALLLAMSKWAFLVCVSWARVALSVLLFRLCSLTSTPGSTRLPHIHSWVNPAPCKASHPTEPHPKYTPRAPHSTLYSLQASRGAGRMSCHGMWWRARWRCSRCVCVCLCLNACVRARVMCTIHAFIHSELSVCVWRCVAGWHCSSARLHPLPHPLPPSGLCGRHHLAAQAQHSLAPGWHLHCAARAEQGEAGCVPALVCLPCAPACPARAPFARVA